MANTITFTPTGSGAGSPVVVTPIPGSVQINDPNEDRGGGDVPNARAGVGAAGQCRVVLDDAGDNPALADLQTLADTCCTDSAGDVSPVGSGATTVEGADAHSGIGASGALIDVTIEGDAVQIATITWKGSAAA